MENLGIGFDCLGTGFAWDQKGFCHFVTRNGSFWDRILSGSNLIWSFWYVFGHFGTGLGRSLTEFGWAAVGVDRN